MTNKISLIISVILLCIIIIYTIYEKRKIKNVYKDTLYNDTNKLKRLLHLLSCLTFIIFFMINVLDNNTNLNTHTIIKSIINSLSIAILVSPLTLSNLYITSFKEEEKKSHIKTIITNTISQKLLKQFKKANINIILLSPKENDLKIKVIEESQIKKETLTKNIQIKTNNLEILDKMINKDTTIKEFQNIEELYIDIYNARGTHDNYIRNIKYIIRTYLSIIISFFFLLVTGFPLIYNLLLSLLLKICTILTSKYIYKYLPYDTDIMERKVKEKNIFIGAQEVFLTIIESFCVAFAVTIPYMFTLSQGGSQEFANTLYFNVFILTELFLIFSNLSDSFIIKNIFKSIKNIRIIVFVIFSILLMVLFNYTSIFHTRNIYFQNNLSCLLFSMIPIFFNEITKLSRYLSKKGKQKNEFKNNKKQRRSKSNNT